jgi:hypothetical protein
MTNGSRTLWVACVLATRFLSSTAAAAEASNQAPVNVRIYDYAPVPIEVLARAQDEVRRVYATIGVQTTWLDTRHMSDHSRVARPVQHVTEADLIVIVLNATMTTRMATPDDVIGMAANTPTGHGHIAYVFYDRLEVRSLQSYASSVSALAFVMAHEMGHLLLPYGSHSDVGVMRGRWNRDAFSRLDIQQLQFTPVQGRQIREFLEFGW